MRDSLIRRLAGRSLVGVGLGRLGLRSLWLALAGLLLLALAAAACNGGDDEGGEDDSGDEQTSSMDESTDEGSQREGEGETDEGDSDEGDESQSPTATNEPEGEPALEEDDNAAPDGSEPEEIFEEPEDARDDGDGFEADDGFEDDAGFEDDDGFEGNGDFLTDLAGFADLESYRFTIEVQGELDDPEGDLGELSELGSVTIAFQSEGAFVAPDRLQLSCEGDFLGFDLSEDVIIIGEQSWVRNSQTGGEFVEGMAQFCGPDLSPAGFTEDFDADDLAALEGTVETVNGVEAVRYDLDQSFLEQLAALAGAFGDPGDLDDFEDLPEDFAFRLVLWLARDGGWPVRFEFELSGSEGGGSFELQARGDVLDANSSGISIDAP